jgi:small redox-active disulfide protein 2
MEVERLNVKGYRVGVIGLTEIFEDLKKSQITGEDAVSEHLLRRVKERNYVAESAAEDYRNALYREYRRFLGEDIEEDEGVLVIKILGPGCTACERLESETFYVLQELNISADVDHVRDVNEIARYGIAGTPALIINGTLKCSGRVPLRSQLKEWLHEAAGEDLKRE